MICLVTFTVYKVSMDFNTGNQGDHNAIPEQIRNPIQPEPPVPHPPEVPEIKDVEKKGNSVIVQSPIEVVKKNKVLNDVPHNPVNVRTNRTGDSERIRQAALDINSKEEVHNLARFPSRSNESIVLLVMVHKRLEYLRYLINSLRKVRGIGDALIIFSHDYYDEEINALIKTVDFCQVQIIFVFFSAFTFLNALFPLFSSQIIVVHAHIIVQKALQTDGLCLQKFYLYMIKKRTCS